MPESFTSQMSFEEAPNAEEQQPLIDHAANASEEDKQEPDTQPNMLASPNPTVPRAAPVPIEDYTLVEEGNIRLGSPEPQPHANRFWAFENVRPENRDILEDFTRGLLILVTTPIAFAGMGIYACGLIIEGVALMMKGVGSLGGRVFVGRRRRTQQTADPQWV